MNKAIFRLPHESRFIIVKNKEATKVVASFFPFVQGKQQDIFSDIEYTESLEDDFFNIQLSEAPTQTHFPNQQEYIKKVERAIEVVKENEWSKLVISRPINHQYYRLDIKQTYLNLCKKYPNALCYFWVYEDAVWIGATPEVLGKFNKQTQVFETMSLAGTLPVTEEWTNKEIEEQRPVTRYIQDILSNFSEEIEISETYNHISGEIKHLRNDLSCKIKENQLLQLIDELHPTPAICGIPKKECLEKILEIEGYNRAYYSGYIKIETEEQVYYFVNLRCSQLFKNSSMVYVGGGITAQSIPEKEWQETELKSHAMLKNFYSDTSEK